MEKQEFLDLDGAAQLKFLNSKAEAGQSFEEISSEMDISKEEFGKYGFYYAGKKFMLKPMRGYRTTRRSGYEKTVE